MGFSLFLMVAAGLLLGTSVKAVCPVCAVAVGVGVGFSRYLGIDDTITGVWVGGLVLAMSLWTIDWLDRKKIQFNGRAFITTLAFYALSVLPPYWMGIMGHPENVLFGVDKILLGVLVGSAVFLASVSWYEDLKKKNGGHAYFPFQKVAMPIGALLAASLLFYLLTA